MQFIAVMMAESHKPRPLRLHYNKVDNIRMFHC